MYRILYTIPNFDTAGSGLVIYDIVRKINREIFEPWIVVLHKANNTIEKQISKLGIPIIEAPFVVPVRPRKTLLIRAFKASRNFKEYPSFDIWHSFHYNSNYVEPIIAKLSGARYWIYEKKNMSWGARAWYLRSLLADKIITINSDMNKLFFKSSLFKRKIEYIPLGVDPDKFNPENTNSFGIRKQFGIEASTPVLGVVANFIPIKGHITLLKAASKIPSVHFLLAGKFLDTSYGKSLKELCLELKICDRVHFIGYIENIPSFLKEIDIFALLTKYPGEGLGIALLEAMAMQKPCIGTNVPGIKDIIKPNVNGILVPPEDPPSFTHAVNLLLSNPQLQKRLAQNARKTVLESYTIDLMVRKREQLYSRLLKD